MTRRYSASMTKSELVMLLAVTVLLGLGGIAHAKLIKVTATGIIGDIFNITSAPFSIGDPFTYEVIVNDDTTLDSNPNPNYTVHEYLPNFLAERAGSAKLTIGSYTISESTAGSTTLFIGNDTGFSDVIEIISTTIGAPSIDGIEPYGFSLKREDFTQTALSSAVISEGLFTSGGFGDVDAVYLSVTSGGACLDRKCVIGDITNVTTKIVSQTPTAPAINLLLLGD